MNKALETYFLKSKNYEIDSFYKTKVKNELYHD